MAELKFGDVFKVMNLAFGIEPWDDKDMGEKSIVFIPDNTHLTSQIEPDVVIESKIESY
jgi:hypothetical protein